MQKVWKVAALLVILSLASACTRTAGEGSRVWDEAQESAVYSALIERELAIPLSFFNLDDTLLIVNTAFDGDDYENLSDDILHDELPALEQATLADFRLVTRAARGLDLPLTIGKPYAYVAQPGSYADWLAIHQKYPDTMVYVMFSRVGFNPGYDQALVYMAHRCGDECGYGALYFLVRRDGAWQVEKEITAWFS